MHVHVAGSSIATIGAMLSRLESALSKIDDHVSIAMDGEDENPFYGYLSCAKQVFGLSFYSKNSQFDRIMTPKNSSSLCAR